MIRRRTVLRAADLMEPLRAVVGATQRLVDVADRLDRHATPVAPVVSCGRAMGLVSRARVADAVRLGLGELTVGEITCGGAPAVGPADSLETIAARCRGIAPGLVVATRGGIIRGVISRSRLEEALHRGRRRVTVPAHARARQRLRSHLPAHTILILGRVGRLAKTLRSPVYLVGGVVRDALLGHESNDLDVVVEGDGLAFARRLARACGARLKRHAMFGTASVEIERGRHCDVATARRETYARPGALPDVAPASMLEDLFRRDVTINSIAIRLDGASLGQVRDDLGGLRDLSGRRLRVHHILSMVEDPTRAFRVARFSARLGFDLTEETRRSIKLAHRSAAFEGLTGERLYREFSYVGEEADPTLALGAMARLDLLRVLEPGLRFDARRRGQFQRLVNGLRRGPLRNLRELSPPGFLFLVLLSEGSAPSRRIGLSRRLRLQGRYSERLVGFSRPLTRLIEGLARGPKPSRMARLCESVPEDVLAIAWSVAEPAVRHRIDRYLLRLRSVRAG
ncbi:MAG: hypothetical protein ACE5HU_09325, partial [Acidobacteriota bacterium]